jgi:hypothetical protein
MPFDGSTFSPEQRVLRGMMEWFARDDAWFRGDYDDDQGRACLFGAMHRVERECWPGKHSTRRYLHRAIQQHYRSGRIDDFNDYRCSNIVELRDVVQFAYALACAYPPDGLPKPPSKRVRWTPGGMPDAYALAHLVPRPDTSIAQQLPLPFA